MNDFFRYLYYALWLHLAFSVINAGLTVYSIESDEVESDDDIDEQHRRAELKRVSQDVLKAISNIVGRRWALLFAYLGMIIANFIHFIYVFKFKNYIKKRLRKVFKKKKKAGI